MKHIKTFFQGIAIGLSNIVPGVSGGTIAFILGIYEKFINSLKNLNLKFLIYFIQSFFSKNKLKKAKKEFLKFDPLFLSIFGLGIITAIITGAFIMPFLLDNYSTNTYGFFFGLIVYSIAKLILDNKKHITPTNIIFLITGFFGGFLLTGFDTLISSHSLLILFITGIIGMSSMLLPGLSGSFMLLVLGQYRYIINMIKNFQNHILEISVFIGGLLFGVIGFSKSISYLLKNHYAKTLFFLIGLMAGSLRMLANNIVLNSNTLFIFLVFVLVGFFFYDILKKVLLITSNFIK